MVDRQFREAQRYWQFSGSYESWVYYLQQARRAGNSIFTEDHLRELLRSNCLPSGSELAHRRQAAYKDGPPPLRLEYFDTEDGFIARVGHAFTPPIERTYNVRTTFGYEPESFPYWDRWSGTIKVCWTTDFDPPCPGLEIKVKAFQQPDGGYYITREEPDEEEYVYEGDCVASAEQLEKALCDESNWLEI